MRRSLADALAACRIRFLLPWLLALSAAGCAGAGDADRLEAFAEAGIAYADKAPALMDQSFEAAVAVDSGALLEERSRLSEPQRREAIEKLDEVMEERRAGYAVAKRHNDLLKSYFEALKRLSRPDAGKGVGAAAKKLAAELGKLSPTLKELKIGGAPVGSLVEPAVELAVGSFRSSWLRGELEARGVVIERELALQQALVAAMARQIRADRAESLSRYRRNQVVEPYVSAGRLPGTWASRRLRSLREAVDVEAARAAEKAVRSLRAAYVAAAAKRLDDLRTVELTIDVQRFVDLVSRLTGEGSRVGP